jgi:hypothetical protein
LGTSVSLLHLGNHFDVSFPHCGTITDS